MRTFMRVDCISAPGVEPPPLALGMSRSREEMLHTRCRGGIGRRSRKLLAPFPLYADTENNAKIRFLKDLISSAKGHAIRRSGPTTFWAARAMLAKAIQSAAHEGQPERSHLL